MPNKIERPGKKEHQERVNNSRFNKRVDGFNECHDQFTAWLEGLDIEKMLGDIEIPLDTDPMYVEETKNPAVIKLKSRYAYIIAQAIKTMMRE